MRCRLLRLRAARRSGAAAVGMAALDTTPAIAQTNARKTFVLVHSAWHGGWCWRRVADILEDTATRFTRNRLLATAIGRTP